MALLDFFGFGKKKKKKEEKKEFNLKILEKVAPFTCKVLGGDGKYIVNIYLPKVDRWISNIALIHGSKIYIHHEPEEEKVKAAAEISGIPLEYEFEVKDTWDLINKFAEIYENLCKLYRGIDKKTLYTLEDKFQSYFKRLKIEKDPFLCAELFKILTKIKEEEEDHYRIFRQRLLKECENLLKQNGF